MDLTWMDACIDAMTEDMALCSRYVGCSLCESKNEFGIVTLLSVWALNINKDKKMSKPGKQNSYLSA